jgi:hypothetical protein
MKLGSSVWRPRLTKHVLIASGVTRLNVFVQKVRVVIDNLKTRFRSQKCDNRLRGPELKAGAAERGIVVDEVFVFSRSY